MHAYDRRNTISQASAFSFFVSFKQVKSFLCATTFSNRVTLSRQSQIIFFPFKEVKLFLCFNWAPRHEGILGSDGTAPRILNLGTRWRWVVSFTPWPLYPQRKSPWYPLNRRLGGTQSRFERSGEEKNSQPLPGIEPPSPSPHPSAIPLSYPGSFPFIWTVISSYTIFNRECSAWAITSLLF
jgi:hypothetical protein